MCDGLLEQGLLGVELLDRVVVACIVEEVVVTGVALPWAQAELVLEGSQGEFWEAEAPGDVEDAACDGAEQVRDVEVGWRRELDEQERRLGVARVAGHEEAVSQAGVKMWVCIQGAAETLNERDGAGLGLA
jgi:hypothetical protein